uniref:Uncharacterized protein n=1 Tax=Myoviridae sp. ctBtT5 TaxID=2825048 RepID=A0A8S5Q076_9CAUD|nr:MAG TPA: hypothetical protein [Myoviridae sp. ctBtT5]
MFLQGVTVLLSLFDDIFQSALLLRFLYSLIEFF